MKTTSAKAIVDEMLIEGVSKAFCVPGESYLSILNELFDESNIELITGRQEGGVSFMAEGYAKASGKVGVCFATRGPGATNLSIGLHTAKHDSTPVVAFIGQVEKKFRGRDAFQEIDLAEYFKHIVKWTVELDDPSRSKELIRRAFHTAKTGRPGPVLVSLPEDILDQTLKSNIENNTVNIFSSPRPEQEAISKTCKTLLKAKFPVIIVGGGVISSKATDELVELSERLKIPVATAYHRLDAFPNNHPNYIGNIWGGAPDYLVDTIKNADVVIAIGTRLSQNSTLNYSLINSESKLIHVDISPLEINKVFSPYLGIIADAKQYLNDLLNEVKQINTNEERMNKVKVLHKKYNEYSYCNQIYAKDYVDLEGLIFDLKTQLPVETIITSDAGSYLGWLFKHHHFNKVGTYIGPTSGAMGYGLPAAIGAQIAHPNSTIVSFSGDGGFMMTAQEMETAVRNNLPIISIVATNNSFGTIKNYQEKTFPGRPIGTQITNPNFAKLGTNMGGTGEVVESNKDFIPALKRALKNKKPSVIEVMLDSKL